jgi:ATP-binding cassette subfamily C protein CydCD
VVGVLDGASDLLAWGGGSRAVDQVAEASRRVADASSRTSLGAGLARALVTLTCGLGVAGMASLADGPVADGALSPAMAALLVLVPMGLSEVLVPVADAGAVDARTAGALARLRSLEATTPAVADPSVAAPLEPPPHDVRLSGAAAGWGDVPVVHSVDLDLPSGQAVGVVGPSGCGKSTLAALLLRFLDPIDGAVRLDRVDLRDLRLDDVRRTVGLVDDDPHVFASTVVENVRLARPAATDAEVAEALRRTRLGDWLDGLPDGLDSWLGDGGADVSGGERARLALARSLLADQPVLVLDEPVAHLDSATAEAVTSDLLDASDGRSVVLISHRHEGLDRVGQVLDLGQHQFLTRRPGLPTSPAS